MALRDVQAVVTITTNATKAIDDGKKLRETYKATLDIIKQFRKDGKIDTPEGKELLKLADDLQAKIKALVTGMDLIRGVADNLANKTGKDVNRALREISKEFNKTANETDADKQKLEELRTTLAKLKDDQSIRKGLTMPLEEAKKQLNDLVNTSPEKLRQGLAAINKELDKTTNPSDRAELKGYARQYEAQMAVTQYGRAGNASLGSMNADQLRAEQQRLRSAYLATDGAKGYETISQEYIDRLHEVNKALIERTHAQQQADKAVKDSLVAQDKAAKMAEIEQRISTNQKVSLQELTELQKHYQAELQKMQGMNLTGAEQQAVENMKVYLTDIEKEIHAIEGTDPKKVINDLDNASLDQLEAALKNLQKQAAEGIKVGDDKAIAQAAQDMETLERKIADVKAQLDGIDISKLDFDHLEDVPTEKLEQALKDLEAQEKRLAGTDKQAAQQMAENKRKVQAQITRNKQAVQDYANAEKIAGETGKHNVIELRQAYETLQQKLLSLNTEQKKEIEQVRQQMKQVKSAIDETTGSIAKQGGAWSTAVKNITAYVGVFAMFNKIKTTLNEAYEANKRFSDQLANVRKVSNLAMDDINQLAKNLSTVDSRTSLSGLMELSYTGAKLGFGNYGIEGLEAFARSAVKVQNALSEDMGEESMTALSKLVEVMGLIPKMGVEKAMDAAGSAIFRLASTSTATGTNIIEFTKRLMGLANTSHVAVDELLALGSASDAMGLMPEVASTAFNKIFTSVQTNTKGIAKALGDTTGQLQALVDKGETMNAIVYILEKMHTMSMQEMKGRGLFKELGSDGARLNNVIATMSNRVDMLQSHLETAKDAFADGTAVAQEYAIQMDTAAAYSERAANIWEKAFVNPEGVDTVKDFSKAWYEVSKSLTESEKTMFLMKISLQGLVLIVKTLLQMIPELMGMFAIGGIAAWTTKLREGEGALVALTTRFQQLSAAQKAFFKGMGWAGLAIAIFEVGKAIYDAHQKMKDAQTFMKGFRADLGQLQSQYESAEDELRRYKKAIDDAVVGTNQHRMAIKNFNEKFGGYLKNLLTEKSTALEIAAAYKEVCRQLRNKIALQLRDEDMEQFVKPEEKARGDIGESYEERTKGSTQYSQFNRQWLRGYVTDDTREDLFQSEGAQRATINDLMKQMGITLSQDVKDEILKQVNAGRAGYSRIQLEHRYGTPGGTTSKDLATEAELILFDALRYIRQEDRVRQATKKVYDKYGDIDAGGNNGGDEIDTNDYEPGTTKEEEKSRLEKLRSDFKQAKENAEGLIAKIDEWYNLQEAAVKDAEAMGQMSKQQAEDLVKTMEILRNQSLSKARKAVGSGEQDAIDDWQNWAKTVLPSMLADSSKWSADLMKATQEVDVKALYDFLKQFNGSKEMAKLDASSFLDTILKKGAESLKKAQVLRAQFREKLDTFVKQNQPILLAQEKLENDLSAMGFITETYEEMAARIAEGRAKEPKNVGMKASQRTEMTGQFRWENAARQQQAQWQGTPALDTDNAAQMQQWLQQFAGGAQWASGIQQLDEWMKEGNAEKYKAEIRRFYDALLQYEQGYADNSKETMEQATAAFNDLLGRRMTDREAYAQAGMKFVGQGTIPYKIDITNQQEALQWLRQFATDEQGGLEQWAQAFPMIVSYVERIKEAEKDGTIGEAELAALQDAMPQIEALYLRMISFSDNVGKNIEQQVNAMMPSRSPIGLSEMEAQYQQRRSLTTSLYDQQIDQANAAGGPAVNDEGDNASAVELKRQRDQTLIDMEYQYQQQLWQIREQMGVTWAEELDHEIAMYQNMLDKQLISQEQFEKKKKQSQISNGLKNAQYYNGLMSNMVDALQEYEIAAVEAKYAKEIQAAQDNGQDTAALEAQKEAEIYEIRKKYAGLQFAVKISEIIANTAVAIMQAYAQLGPIGGTIAAAMLTATGAAQLALAKAEYDKVMGGGPGGSSKASSSGGKTKLVSGMLTYDEGNLSSATAPGRSPSGQQSYLGTDGHVYRARQATPPEGVSLVTRPIATTVQGQPALVAERGPEIVIGRRTTRAIQMNEPELLTRLAQYDRHHSGPRLRTFDDGNLADSVPAGSASGNGTQQTAEQNERIAAALDQNTQMMAAFVQMMTTIQRQGIPAHINKYGTGGLIDEVKSGLKFDAKYNR